MAKKQGRLGKSLPVRAPEWEPLVDLVPEHVGEFMWMCSIELRDKTRIQNYKHYWTRRNLHLDGDGRAFYYVWDEDWDSDEDGRYERIDTQEMLRLVLERGRLAEWPQLPAEIDDLRRVVCRVPTRLRNAAQKRADEEKMSLADFAAEALRAHVRRPLG